MRTPLAHNNFSSVRTQSTIPVPCYRKNDPPSPLHGQSLPASVTPKNIYTPLNNPPKPVPYIPIDSDPDPSFHILLRRTHMTPGIINKYNLCIRYVVGKGVTMTLLKIAPISHPSYLRLHKIPGSKSSNWMRIPYSARFISCLS